MAFDDLSISAYELLRRLLESHASGRYHSDFHLLQNPQGEWSIKLIGLEGIKDEAVKGFSEGDLLALEINQYLGHNPQRSKDSFHLTQKAFEQLHLSQAALRLSSKEAPHSSRAHALNDGETADIFISYSHKDKKLFDQLQTSLKPLVREKKISVWDDTKIKSGDAWREQIKAAIASAKVAVLLVSPDYLASDFIAEHELPPLLEAAQNDGLRILWIAARFSMYEETEIARYQAINDPARPLAGISGANREKEFVRICKEIKSAALETTTEHRHIYTGHPGTGSTQNEPGGT